MPKDPKTLKFLDKILIYSHIVFDGYFFIIMIPTNLLGPSPLKIFNLWVALTIGGVNLAYKRKCPLTVYRNRVRRALNKPTSDTAIADFIEWAGIAKRPSLATVNKGVAIFVFFLILSFIPLT